MSKQYTQKEAELLKKFLDLLKKDNPNVTWVINKYHKTTKGQWLRPACTLYAGQNVLALLHLQTAKYHFKVQAYERLGWPVLYLHQPKDILPAIKKTEGLLRQRGLLKKAPLTSPI